MNSKTQVCKAHGPNPAWGTDGQEAGLSELPGICQCVWRPVVERVVGGTSKFATALNLHAGGRAGDRQEWHPLSCLLAASIVGNEWENRPGEGDLSVWWVADQRVLNTVAGWGWYHGGDI